MTSVTALTGTTARWAFSAAVATATGAPAGLVVGVAPGLSFGTISGSTVVVNYAGGVASDATWTCPGVISGLTFTGGGALASGSGTVI